MDRRGRSAVVGTMARVALAAVLSVPLAWPSMAKAADPAAASIQPPATPEPLPPGGRGRDPWVFRCLFEERTRMLIVAPRPKVWIAFSIPSGAIYKAWHGDMVFRGKVWDFSQNSSMAKGDSLLSWNGDLVRLEDKDAAPTSGWAADKVEFSKDGWAFSSAESTLTSPVFDATGWTRLFIAYEELSRKGPVRVEVSTDGGASWDAQWFDSTMHGSRDDEWQWGFKQIAVEPTAAMRVRFRQRDASFAKKLRNIRVFGDKIAWWQEYDGHTKPATVTWSGHELIKQTDGVVLRYVVGEHWTACPVREFLDATMESGTIRITQRLEVDHIPIDRVSGSRPTFRLALPTLGAGGKRECSVPGALGDWHGGPALLIDHPGVYKLTSTFPESEAKR